MGPWTYYAPLWLGSLLCAALYVANLGQLPAWPTWVHVLIVAGGAPLAGGQLQLGLIGLQGVFAQVVPVPGGRSIRGGSAAAIGGLLLGWFALALVAGLLWAEGLGLVVIVLGGLAAGCLAAAVIAYVWQLPAAVRDFGPAR